MKQLIRSSKLRILTTTLFLSFLFYVTRSLAYSDALRLDPLIDPVTYQLSSPGDPSKRVTAAHIDPAIVDAIAASQAAAQRWWLENGTINAWPHWYDGDDKLRNNRPATRFTCDDGRDGRPRGSLIFLAIFTTPAMLAKRQLLRSLFIPDLPPTRSDEPPLIDVVFVSARPSNDNWRYQLEVEKAKYGDIVWLETIDENIDTGKTAKFFEWLTAGADGRWPSSKRTNRKSRDPRKFARPQFVMKADDDGFLVIPNLIKHLGALTCSNLVYWGTAQGSSPSYPAYFRGLGYALSWPLVEWIGTAGMSAESMVGVEDARVGAWLTELNGPRDKRPDDYNHAGEGSEIVERHDVGWKMGDWDQMVIDEETIGMHWLKLDEWVPMVKRKVLVAWEGAGREFRWDYYEQARKAQLQSTPLPSLPVPRAAAPQEDSKPRQNHDT